MNRRPVFSYNRVNRIHIMIHLVFKANFNDIYYLREIDIPLDGLSREELYWFDPYDGECKNAGTKIAIAECSDEEFLILEKCGDTIKEARVSNSYSHIVSEDNNESTLIAAQINIR